MACVDCRSGEHAAKHVGCSSALAGSYRTGRWHLRAAALGIRQSPHVWAGKHDVVVDPEGKPSVTNFRVLKRFSNATLIEASPLTGRTHQIRVHCQYAGHPIVGDQKYTATTRDQFSETKILCLHAAMISFDRPESDQRFSASAPINPMMLQLLDSLH